MTEFKPGDTVAINGPIDHCTGIATIIRLERWAGIDRAVCLRSRNGADEGFGTHSIPLRHLHPVSEVEYQAWNEREFVRRFQPPVHGPVRAPAPEPVLDRETERAIRILAISDALTASWRARGVISGTPGRLNMLDLPGETEAA